MRTRKVLSKLNLLTDKEPTESGARQLKHPFIRDSMEAIQANTV